MIFIDFSCFMWFFWFKKKSSIFSPSVVQAFTPKRGLTITKKRSVLCVSSISGNAVLNLYLKWGRRQTLPEVGAKADFT